MAEAPILGASASKKAKLDDAAFAQRFHEPLVHQSVRAEQAARRRGTAATKTRGMVSGGGAKPWRQKGTGRARAGSSRSPLWTGGGVVFGPQPRSYTFKVNRKEQRAALRSALSLHAGRGSLALVEADAFTEPKTSQARELLEGWAPGEVGGTLVVLDASERDAALSFRNLAKVAVLTSESVGVADLLRAGSVVASQAALDSLTARAIGNKAEAEAAGAKPTAKAKKAPAKRKASAPASEQSPASEETTVQGRAETADEQVDEEVS
jgi:large subunit ribosomal protein L4